MLPIGSADIHGINYAGKYDFLHNYHVNKSCGVNTKKKAIEENKVKVPTWILVVSLMT